MDFNKEQCTLVLHKETQYDDYTNNRERVEIWKDKTTDKEYKRTLQYTRVYHNDKNLSKQQINSIQKRVKWAKFGKAKTDRYTDTTKHGITDTYFEFSYDMLFSKQSKEYISQQIINYLNDDKYAKICVNVPFVNIITYHKIIAPSARLDELGTDSDDIPTIMVKSTNNYPMDCNAFSGDTPKDKVIELFNDLIKKIMDNPTALDNYTIRKKILVIVCDDDPQNKDETALKVNEFNKRLQSRVSAGTKDESNEEKIDKKKDVYVPRALRVKKEEPAFIDIKTGESSTTSKKSNINYKCIMLSNLPDEITREDLEDWLRNFRSAGVIRYKLNTIIDKSKINDDDDDDDYDDNDGNDGYSEKIKYIRNFAFLDFRNVNDSAKTLEVLERKTFYNTIVHSEYAKKKKN